MRVSEMKVGEAYVVDKEWGKKIGKAGYRGGEIVFIDYHDGDYVEGDCLSCFDNPLDGNMHESAGVGNRIAKYFRKATAKDFEKMLVATSDVIELGKIHDHKVVLYSGNLLRIGCQEFELEEFVSVVKAALNGKSGSLNGLKVAKETFSFYAGGVIRYHQYQVRIPALKSLLKRIEKRLRPS